MVSAMARRSAFSPFFGAVKRTFAPWAESSFAVSHSPMASASSGSTAQMTSRGTEVVTS